MWVEMKNSMMIYFQCNVLLLMSHVVMLVRNVIWRSESHLSLYFNS